MHRMGRSLGSRTPVTPPTSRLLPIMVLGFCPAQIANLGLLEYLPLLRVQPNTKAAPHLVVHYRFAWGNKTPDHAVTLSYYYYSSSFFLSSLMGGGGAFYFCTTPGPTPRLACTATIYSLCHIHAARSRNLLLPAFPTSLWKFISAGRPKSKGPTSRGNGVNSLQFDTSRHIRPRLEQPPPLTT